MRNWTISKLMVAMVVVAFLAMLTQAEGCGEHVARITDLQLAPDDRTLAVSRADGRVSHDNYHRYVNDLWLTRSLMNAHQGTVIKVLESHASTGSGGELRSYRSAPWFSFSQHHLYFPTQDHQLVCYDYEGRQKSKVALPGSVACVAVSPDETHILYGDVQSSMALLITAEDRKVVWRKAVHGIALRYFGALALSDQRFATLDFEQLQYGSYATNVQYKTKSLRKNGISANSVHLVKSGSQILVAFDEFFDLVDADTGQANRFELELVGLSSDGGWLVVNSDDGLQLMELETGQRSRVLPLNMDVSIACVSKDGKRVFAVDYYDRLVCIDPTTGKRLWSSQVPGHYRPSMGWLIFLAAASLWAWRRFWSAAAKPPL